MPCCDQTASRGSQYTNSFVLTASPADCCSTSDASCPEEHRGKYLAFTQPGSTGCKHLQDLQQAGLTHIHLLPTYDIGSVPERAADQQSVKVSGHRSATSWGGALQTVRPKSSARLKCLLHDSLQVGPVVWRVTHCKVLCRLQTVNHGMPLTVQGTCLSVSFGALCALGAAALASPRCWLHAMPHSCLNMATCCRQEDLLQYAMDGEEQQRAVLEIADHDGFNWG